MKINIKNIVVIQFAKYFLVGVMNTLITFILIFVCKTFLGINEYVSNGIGYVGGLINSFIWNKKWVFKSDKKAHIEALKFAVGFLLCYGVQLLVVWALYEHTFLKTYEFDFGFYTCGGYGLATILGNFVYSFANFCYNRFVTFK